MLIKNLVSTRSRLNNIIGLREENGSNINVSDKYLSLSISNPKEVSKHIFVSQLIRLPDYKDLEEGDLPIYLPQTHLPGKQRAKIFEIVKITDIGLESKLI